MAEQKAQDINSLKTEFKDKTPEFVTTSLEVPTMFVDGIGGTMNANGVMRLSFYEDKLDVKIPDVKRRHVVTLAISEKNFREIADFLSKLASDESRSPTDEGKDG